MERSVTATTDAPQWVPSDDDVAQIRVARRAEALDSAGINLLTPPPATAVIAQPRPAA